MKKFISFCLVFASMFAFSQIGISQTASSNRWTFGGGLGVGFGSNSSFNVGVSPRVGYRLTEDFEAGLMGNFTYQTSDYYNSTMFGVGPFANYYFARNFYLGSSFQQYFVNYNVKQDNGYKFSKDESALYLGGGYMTQIGNGSYFQVGLMYNVLWKENKSIFASGLVPSVGFVVGL